MASDSIADEPVQNAAANLMSATAPLPASAARTTIVVERAPAMELETRAGVWGFLRMRRTEKGRADAALSSAR
jgi:hypothetical protein